MLQSYNYFLNYRHFLSIIFSGIVFLPQIIKVDAGVHL